MVLNWYTLERQFYGIRFSEMSYEAVEYCVEREIRAHTFGYNGTPTCTIALKNMFHHYHVFYNFDGRVEMSLSTLSGHKSRYQIEYFPDRCPRRQFQLFNHGKELMNFK